MALKRKKIGLIFASGSLISIRGNRTIFFVDEEKKIPKWLSEVPEIALLANIQPFYIQGEEDTFDLNSIERIITTLAEQRNAYDGFVVLVRAENLIRASVAAEFMLQNFGKPIVFTGSRYSPEALAEQNTAAVVKRGGLGLRSNLINAVQVAASSDFPTTAIIFGNKIIKPTKAVRSDFYGMNLFKSFDDTYLGKVDFGITLQRSKKAGAPAIPVVYKKLSRDVTVVDASLNDYQDVASPSKKEQSAILIHLLENQKLEQETIIALREKFETVILFNEHYVLDHHGVVALYKMTWSTALMKILWAHAAAKNKMGFADLLRQPIVNEFFNL